MLLLVVAMKRSVQMGKVTITTILLILEVMKKEAATTMVKATIVAGVMGKKHPKQTKKGI